MRKTCFTNATTRFSDFMAFMCMIALGAIFSLVMVSPREAYAQTTDADDSDTTETAKATYSEIGRFRITVPAAPEEPQPVLPFRPVLDSSNLVITATSVTIPFSQPADVANKSSEVAAQVVAIGAGATGDEVFEQGVKASFTDDGKATIVIHFEKSDQPREFDVVWYGKQ